MSGILALQSEVSQKVARALALKLLPAEQARLANARAVNPEAYEAYLKGYQYAMMLTKASLDTAFNYFELATKKDPNYALAYASIAGVWNKRNQMGLAPWAEAIPKSRAASRKALEIDDSLPDAHLYLASSYIFGEFDFEAGGRELERVAELGGLKDDVGYMDLIMGRPDDAMAKAKKGLALDPFNLSLLSGYATVLHCAKRHEEAVAQARKALAIQFDAPVARIALYLSLRELKKYDEVADMDKTNLSGFPEFQEAFVRAYAKLGYVKAWASLADDRAALHDKGMDAIEIADSYMLRGDKAKALDWLDKAYEEHNPMLPFISCYPRYDPLRSEPRFQALLRRMGIPVDERK
jgi:tetratricopeptide (TPR) repeat protein